MYVMKPVCSIHVDTQCPDVINVINRTSGYLEVTMHQCHTSWLISELPPESTSPRFQDKCKYYGWVYLSVESITNCSSLERFHASSIGLQAITQIDLTYLQIGIILYHTDILFWAFKINMNIFVQTANAYIPFGIQSKTYNDPFSKIFNDFRLFHINAANEAALC